MGRGFGAWRGGACARALAAGAPPLGRHVGWRVGVKRCTGSGRSRLSSVAGGCSLALARAGNGGEPRRAGLGAGVAREPGWGGARTFLLSSAWTPLEHQLPSRWPGRAPCGQPDPTRLDGSPRLRPT